MGRFSFRVVLTLATIAAAFPGCKCSRSVGVHDRDGGLPEASTAPDAAPSDAGPVDGAPPGPDGRVDPENQATCVGRMTTDEPGFETVDLVIQGDFVTSAGGDVEVYLASPPVDPERVIVWLSIPPDWDQGGQAMAELSFYSGSQTGPVRIMNGTGGAGVDLHRPSDRLRGWFNLVFSDSNGVVNARGRFEALSQNATCLLRRCLNGEFLYSGDPCCCDGQLEPAFNDLPVARYCINYENTGASPASFLRACTGACGAGEICVPQPGDATTGFCRNACQSNQDCPLYEICDGSGACRPSRCGRDDDCGPDRRCVAQPGATPYCSGQNFDGEDPCLPTLDSHYFPHLDGTFCARPCANDGDCDAGWICEGIGVTGNPNGWCAPECTVRSCANIRGDFDEVLTTARSCVDMSECTGIFGDCGLWEPWWEHCSAYLTIGASTDVAALDTYNAEWISLCTLYPGGTFCAMCDAPPDCGPTCDLGVCACRP